MQYSDQYDFGDSDFVGFPRWVPISKLRACQDYIVNEKGEKISDKDLAGLAKKYSNINNNKAYQEKLTSDTDRNTNIDDMKVLEYVFYWRDVEKQKTAIEYTNKSGQKKRYEYDDTVKKLSKGERIIEMRERKLYTCTWVVGSNDVYAFGMTPKS